MFRVLNFDAVTPEFTGRRPKTINGKPLKAFDGIGTQLEVPFLFPNNTKNLVKLPQPILGFFIGNLARISD